jgi:ribosomal-protein-alanine N-acetyltransferase
LVALERATFSDPWTRRQLTDAFEFDGVVALVATEADRIVGSVLGRVITDEAEILTISVDPGSRRRGVGRLLLDAAVERSRQLGAATIWLEVRESNTAAKLMYQSAGFFAAGVRRGYYRRPIEDAVVLCYRLPASSSTLER